jgi:hypothetical protein
VLDIARKNDQTAHLRLAQQVAIFGRQPCAGNVDHQRTLQGSSHKPSLNNAHNPSPSRRDKRGENDGLRVNS